MTETSDKVSKQIRNTQLREGDCDGKGAFKMVVDGTDTQSGTVPATLSSGGAEGGRMREEDHNEN